ncbi:uncharacterized protein PSFLO_06262 [Pseudozyma flocculosa]|uniref:Uncharacterized protein n=1 Tax=Pseudozyma flocculosa TaxID=84751 RepID=A0A5C3F998_9BASI|nr:uncharacterized protein PSFLO_06262 [Pseudozyma flocculosa]
MAADGIVAVVMRTSTRNGRGAADRPAPRDLFVTDTWGDQRAIQYGPDSSKFPFFDRGGDGYVVGLDGSLRITRQSIRLTRGEALEIKDKSQSYSRRSRDSDKADWKRLRQPGRRLIAPTSTAGPSSEDFISVSRRRRQTEAEGFSVLDNILTKMADEHGGEQGSAGSASDEASDSDAGEAGEGAQVSLKARARELHQRLHSVPTDAPAWLDLADFQDRLGDIGAADDTALEPKSRRARLADRESSRASRRQAVLDVKFSILDKAISAHPDNRRSLALVLGRLQLAADTGRWDTERIEREWRRLLKDVEFMANVDTAIILWQGYLAWRRSDWSSFELGKISDLHAEAVAHFASMAESQVTAAPFKLDEARLALLRGYLGVLEAAGMTERAIATVQALLEVNLCASPPGVSADSASSTPRPSFEEDLQDFEEFWNSSEPRLMEKGARGWAQSRKDGREDASPTSGPTAASHTSKELPDSPHQHPVDRWLQAEGRRRGLRRFPAKLTDRPEWQVEGDEIDAFSTVLFSDLRPFLFRIQSRGGMLGLLDLALAFLGLPSGLMSGLTDSIEGCTDGVGTGCRAPGEPRRTETSDIGPDFWPASLNADASSSPAEPFTYIDGQMMERERRSNLSSPSASPVLCGPATVESLFPGTDDSGPPLARRLRSADPSTLRLAGRLLDQLAPYGQAFAAAPVLQLAVEAALNLKAATKLARKLLSKDRDNHVLWHAYAQLELSAGRTAPARTVYVTALESSTTRFAEDGRPLAYLPQMWSSLAEQLWRSGETVGAAAVIVSAAKCGFSALHPSSVDLRRDLDSAAPPSGLEALRTRKALQSLISASLRAEEVSAVPQHLVHLLVFCLALFDYLILPPGEAFPAAMAVFDDPVQEAVLQPVAERLAMKRAEFMRWHVATGQAYRPAEVRRAFDSAVAVCPANTLLWSHLAAHEMRSKIDNHLRLALESHLSKQERLTTARALAGGAIGRSAAISAPLTPWLFALYVELNLYSDRFNESAARRLMERALDSPAAQASTTLWSICLEFETRLLGSKAGDRRGLKEQQARAKGLLYRAIKACPGSKSIYLFAFRRPLRDAMTIDEIASLYEVMCEKEIRLFVDLDDFLVEWHRSLPAAPGGDKNNENDGSDDDAGGESDDGYDDPFDPNKPYRKRDDKYEQIGGGGGGGGGPGVQRIPTGLHSLPVELLYSIFVLARSPSLAVASRGLRDVFHRAPLGVRVEYLLEMWHDDHLKNLATWRDTRFRACSCGYRRAAGEVHSAPPPGFWKRASILTPGTLALCCASHLPSAANVDPVSYAARFGICTADVVIRLELRLLQIESVHAVLEDHRRRLDRRASSSVPALSDLAGDKQAPVLTHVELPKRIFRALKQVQLGVYTPPAAASGSLPGASGKSRGKKRRRNEEPAPPSLTASAEAVDAASGYPSSLLSLLPPFLASSSDAIGPLPHAAAMELVLLLLSRYGGDANSHSGFPLAMSVHSDSWTLVHILLAHGADPSKKEGLAIQIAVRKGALLGLRTLVERQEKMEKRWAKARAFLDRLVDESVARWWRIKMPSYRAPVGRTGEKEEDGARPEGTTTTPPSSSGSSKKRRLPDRFVPDSRHLREAIKADCWDVVHYLMHEKHVVPDIKALQLMERKGM